MSMDSLPPELLDRVVSHVAVHKARLTGYAALSRAWQYAVEKHTFSHLNISSAALQTFREVVVDSSHAHRRHVLRRVVFTIELPDYEDKACGRFEREADRRLNNEAFTHAIADLFAVLAALENTHSSPIDLVLQRIYSSMDIDRRGEDKVKADRRARSLGQRHDLFQLRYESSYLQLLRPEELPLLNNVVSLRIVGDAARKLAPKVAAELTAKLPKLATTEWLLSDMERKRPDRRMQLRLDFAEQLRLIDIPSLKVFKLTLRHTEPANENFINADVRGQVCLPDDTLSVALRNFTQAQNLTRMTLGGPICVGPELFWPQTTSDQDPKWPVLKVVDVLVSAVRPDGGWYLDQDPDRGGRSSDEDEDETDDDNDSDQESDLLEDTSSERSSGYDSSESFFATDELPPDSYGYPEEKRDQRLNGQEPVRRFRTRPNVECEKLFAAAARAAMRMPELRCMTISLVIKPSSNTRYMSKTVKFTFVAAGKENPRDMELDDKEHPRLYWEVPKGWRMSEDLEQLWEMILGKSGIVRYKEW